MNFPPSTINSPREKTCLAFPFTLWPSNMEKSQRMLWVAALIRCSRFGVPDHNVGVASGSDSSLLRIHPKNSRRSRCGDLDEAGKRELALADSVMMNQLQTVLDTGAAIRNFGEVIFAENLLVLKTEGAMIS